MYQLAVEVRKKLQLVYLMFCFFEVNICLILQEYSVNECSLTPKALIKLHNFLKPNVVLNLDQW